MIELVTTFIFFFTVIDPIGTVPVFIAVTGQHDERAKRKIALQATLVAAGVLVFFVVVGELLLTAMNIPLSAFQISGGIILFTLALTMIFGDNKRDDEAKMATSETETAIFPLAVPSIAGPGAILTAVLLTENHRFDLWQQVQVVCVMLSVLAIVYVLMLAAGWIHRLIGTAGASIIRRVMGLILASLATTNVLTGIKLFLPTLS